MGKGDKRKKQKAKLPEMAAIPRRQPNGQARKRADSASDPRKTALSARCRVLGIPDTRHNRNTLSGQHSGSDLGRVLQVKVKADQIPRLWRCWQDYSAAEATYAIRYIGQSGHPKGASMAMVTERYEADQSHSVDLRSQDERDRDAVAAYMRWQGHLGYLSNAQASLLRGAIHDTHLLWRDCAPTKAGLATLAALEALADVVERRE